MEKWQPCCEGSDTCCCETAEPVEKKRLLVEYLSLDLNTCDRCAGTDKVLEQVLVILKPALDLAGYEIDYRKYEMATAETARQYRFESSPTIRVNGKDIFGTVIESRCGCCGDIAGTEVDCRVFEHNGRIYEVPTKEMITNAIIASLHSAPEPENTNYALPENLRRFYEGKLKKSENMG